MFKKYLHNPKWWYVTSCEIEVNQWRPPYVYHIIFSNHFISFSMLIINLMIFVRILSIDIAQ